LSCETGRIPRCRSSSKTRRLHPPAGMAWRRGASRSRRPHACGEVLCTKPGRSHPCPDWCRAGSGRQRPHDEKSDEAIVPRKRPNKGRQLPAEVVEGRASPKGNSRQAAVVRTPSRVATSIRLAAVRRNACRFKLCAPPTFDPREEPGALAAPAGICAGGEEQSSSLPRP
jgi:hypothetical protein